MELYNVEFKWRIDGWRYAKYYKLRPDSKTDYQNSLIQNGLSHNILQNYEVTQRIQEPTIQNNEWLSNNKNPKS